MELYFAPTHVTDEAVSATQAHESQPQSTTAPIGISKNSSELCDNSDQSVVTLGLSDIPLSMYTDMTNPIASFSSFFDEASTALVEVETSEVQEMSGMAVYDISLPKQDDGEVTTINFENATSSMHADNANASCPEVPSTSEIVDSVFSLTTAKAITSEKKRKMRVKAVEHRVLTSDAVLCMKREEEEKKKMKERAKEARRLKAEERKIDVLVKKKEKIRKEIEKRKNLETELQMLENVL
jgi:hypothetical protein